MIAADMHHIERAWPTVAPIVFMPHTEAEYAQLVSVLDMIIDVVHEDEAHPLASLMEIISILIERYEDEHVPELSDS